jgi:BCD family chlorophyll transporter-like MFS transporter
LALVASGVVGAAFLLTLLAVQGVETDTRAVTPEPAEQPRRVSLREAITEIWEEPLARRFTIFVFVSMLAYSAQDLILEPFAGLVFGLTPGQSTQMAGIQNGGVLLGMILVGALGAGFGQGRSAWWAQHSRLPRLQQRRRRDQDGRFCPPYSCLGFSTACSRWRRSVR